MNYFFQSMTSYTLAARLKGHSDGIYSLSVSPSGNLLASGGKHIFVRTSPDIRSTTVDKI
jgi:WD40 repeat protein